MENEEIIKKENSFFHFLNVGTRQINDIIHRIGSNYLELYEFRELWEIVFKHLLREYFNRFVNKEDDEKIAIGIILRAGLSGFLAAKEILLQKNIPVFLIQTERKEYENAGNIEADMLYCNLPENAPSDLKVIILEPMLATGVSMKQVMIHFKKYNILEENITFLFGVAVQEGIANLFESYPNINIMTTYTGSHIRLNEKKFIVYDYGKMVVGDAGDRWMGISSKGELMNNSNEREREKIEKEFKHSGRKYPLGALNPKDNPKLKKGGENDR